METQGEGWTEITPSGITQPYRQRLFRRCYAGLVLLACLAGGGVLVGRALTGSLSYYLTPTALLAGGAAHQAWAVTPCHLGGLVVAGSIQHGADGVVAFTLTDGHASVPVRYQGPIPDLFHEGSGAIVTGQWHCLPQRGSAGAKGPCQFMARELLAKHDERYQPPAMTDRQPGSKRNAAPSAPLPLATPHHG
ncbi:cytochrome c maturation protein CcmE [Formicincola oecophyllae]|uniref:Cytochrome c-type biogenesis protein CcmE n=2 Tax=Formicincola oecophyllae TaxID=2558361 RepID=A0A4Y6UBW5_9PROT|nr:cytochrome c maturation protein CcmE [Formicincola oecophyllae]